MTTASGVSPARAPDRLGDGVRTRVHGITESWFAVPAMGLLSLLDACVSPVLPEVLLVPLCVAHPGRRWYYAAVCAATSVVGAVVGYYIGYGLWEAGLREFAYAWLPGFTPQSFEATSARFASHAFFWIFVAAFTPLPFKVFTVAAGVCHDQVGMETLVLASAVGRTARFALEVELIHRFGPNVFAALRRPTWRVAVLVAGMFALILAVM